MARIRSRDTKPEWIVRRLVYGMGYRYRLHVKTLPGKPDIVVSRLNRIIEVRGCFWHSHNGCADHHVPESRIGYWKPKLLATQSRDQVNLRKLRKLGWKVLVVWECQTNRLAAISKRIEKFLSA